jgi:cytochrome c oxidase assembly factor CtaG
VSGRSPWAFDAHPVAWVVVVLMAAAYWWAVRRPGCKATGRQAASFLAGLVLLAASITWPIADLASHWSLTVLVVQRLLLTLGVPPLLLLGTPQPVVIALTRPAALDRVIQVGSRPLVAVAVVTIVAVGTLTVGAVQLQSSSAVFRAALDIVLLAAGFLLWTPVVHSVPGADRPSPLGQAAYLIVQSIVPSFLAVVWIFSRHPLYPPFAHTRLFGLMPLTDQQLAGFVAKLGTIAVLWAVAFALVLRPQQDDQEADESATLTWADVERRFERLDRAGRRRILLPPSRAEGPGRQPEHGPPEDRTD